MKYKRLKLSFTYEKYSEHDFQVVNDFLQIGSLVCSKCGFEQEIPKLKINDLNVDL